MLGAFFPSGSRPNPSPSQSPPVPPLSQTPQVLLSYAPGDRSPNLPLAMAPVSTVPPVPKGFPLGPPVIAPGHSKAPPYLHPYREMKAEPAAPQPRPPNRHDRQAAIQRMRANVIRLVQSSDSEGSGS